MPDNATTITSWLKARRSEYFCHVCIGKGTGVEPAQQVNQIIHPLGQSRDFRYMKTNCSECRSDKMCIGYFG